MSIRLRLSKAEAIAVLLAVLALVLLCVGGCTAVPTQGITPGQVEAGAYLGTVVALEATDASTEDAEAFRGAAVVLRGAIAGGEDDPDPKVLSEGWYAELLAAFGVDAPLVVYGVGVFGGVLDDVVVIEGPTVLYLAAGADGMIRGADDYRAVHQAAQGERTRNLEADPTARDWPDSVLRRLGP